MEAIATVNHCLEKLIAFFFPYVAFLQLLTIKTQKF